MEFAEILAWIFIIIAVVFLPFSYYNNKIVFELDERYYNMKDLNKAAVEYLRNKGKECKVIDTTTLLVDGKKYFLTERTINIKAPVQQVVLKKVK
ncbi:hypothetical protein NRP93_001509 [Clostridium botulinum]|nr:hypothetical protein [Clostridium botulinum]